MKKYMSTMNVIESFRQNWMDSIKMRNNLEQCTPQLAFHNDARQLSPFCHEVAYPIPYL